ncbi:MAG: hypothetical protein RLZZ435_2073 [Cyanobacteriota bacterium]|jgi:hypothetical protein
MRPAKWLLKETSINFSINLMGIWKGYQPKAEECGAGGAES